jgi:hypothetical protein
MHRKRILLTAVVSYIMGMIGTVGAALLVPFDANATAAWGTVAARLPILAVAIAVPFAMLGFLQAERLGLHVVYAVLPGLAVTCLGALFTSTGGLRLLHVATLLVVWPLGAALGAVCGSEARRLAARGAP